MIEVILNAAIQLAYFVVVVYVAGFLVSLLNRLFYKIVKQKKAVCYLTGFIGTPIHELSHAAFCVVFFHKIDEISLFQIDEDNGVLGYVRHSYNKKKVYQLLGNYFIGIAPILCGALIICLSAKYLLPDTFAVTNDYIKDLIILQEQGLSLSWFSYVFMTIVGMANELLVELMTGYQGWIYIFIVFCIALHMNLSGADIKNSLVGLPILVALVLVMNIVLALISKSTYTKFTILVSTIGIRLLVVLIMSIVFSVAYVIIGGVIRGGISFVVKLKNLKGTPL